MATIQFRLNGQSVTLTGDEERLLLCLEQLVRRKLPQRGRRLGRGDAELLDPVGAQHPLYAAAEQRARAVTHGREIDRAVGDEDVAIVRFAHAAFADDYLAAG